MDTVGESMDRSR
ncbi:unnamed protein product [Linum tenue]|uniref:Uncharacterized protein n=1 Tax=Linum tenue TaxID=586396 RepID=A0AAV0LZB3_9ROSI|nr:unnamed protein product [Linum tenue]